MSLNLFVEPVKPPEPTSLGGHPLKGLIADHFFEYDGSLIEEVVLTKVDLPVLDSLLRAETKRCQRAMRAQQEHPHGIAHGIDDHNWTINGLTTIIMMINEHGAARVFTGE